MTPMKFDRAWWTLSRAKWSCSTSSRTKIIFLKSIPLTVPSLRKKAIQIFTAPLVTLSRTLSKAISAPSIKSPTGKQAPTFPATKKTTKKLTPNSVQPPKTYQAMVYKKNYKRWHKSFIGWRRTTSHKNKRIRTWFCIWSLQHRYITWFWRMHCREAPWIR